MLVQGAHLLVGKGELFLAGQPLRSRVRRIFSQRAVRDLDGRTREAAIVKRALATAPAADQPGFAERAGRQGVSAARLSAGELREAIG